jgi:diguanylate cyclase
MPHAITSLADAVELVVATLERELQGTAVWVGHLDTDRAVLRVVASAGEASFGLEPGFEAPLETSFCQVMANGSGPELSGDVTTVPAYAGLPATLALEVRSFAGAPLRFADGTAVGTLCAFSRGYGAFDERQLGLIQAFAALLGRELDHQRRRADDEYVIADLRRQASEDPLTGAANRRAFESELDRAFKRGGGSVAIVDIDRFKQVNDLRGHLAGDEILRAVARAMHEVSGRRDTVARLGGDEFGAVLGRDPREWRAALEARLAVADAGAPIHVSIGHADLAGAKSPSSALAAADADLYADKRRGAAA